MWNIKFDTERADLTIPLSESGTGVGQILAMLYVVVTSKTPQSIVIDEPQSFLHPGAIRKMFDIFREYPQHQYIVTTHSPVVITAAQPSTLTLVRKKDAQSDFEPIDVRETEKLRSLLDEVGARLSDVFGADRIIWVEGATEEACFPLIVRGILGRQLWGTEILGVTHTGDLERKHARSTLGIYKKLCKGRGLLPPAIGFIFDREGRSKKEMEDLKRESDKLFHFTGRRMYENYLLHPDAIANVANDLDGFCTPPLTSAKVRAWIDEHRWTFFKGIVAEVDRTELYWQREVHGAQVLDAIFLHFSESRYSYDKVAYGPMLTRWLIEHAREELDEVTAILCSVLAKTTDE